MKMEIPDEIVEKIESALNASIGLALRYERDMMQQFIDAANHFSDAINGV